MSFVLFSACQKNTTAPTAHTVAPKDPTLVTKAEARDTLLANPDAPLKPVQILKKTDNTAFASHDVSKLLVGEIPDNGFYGANNYRIEFIVTDVEKDQENPALYHVKGKNRYKKTITAFQGTILFDRLLEWKDPNLDPEFLNKGDKIFRANGTFEFKEDETLATSGQFSGNLQLEFLEKEDKSIEIWHFSQSSPLKGAGYRYKGTWTSFKDATKTKPVIWARDFFSFANEILKDFSIGEREVEINEKYRHLGWDEFWSGEEWWNETPPTL